MVMVMMMVVVVCYVMAAKIPAVAHPVSQHARTPASQPANRIEFPEIPAS